MLNQVTLIARLVTDVSTRTVGAKDTTIANFRVAWNNPRNDQEKLFIDVDCFGHSATFSEKYLKKGDLVAVVGRIKTDTWEKDNEKKSKTYIVAETVQSLSGKKQSDDDGADTAAQPAQPKRNTRQTAQAAPANNTVAEDDIPF